MQLFSVELMPILWGEAVFPALVLSHRKPIWRRFFCCIPVLTGFFAWVLGAEPRRQVILSVVCGALMAGGGLLARRGKTHAETGRIAS